MKKLIFGGICFLGGLLMMILEPAFDAWIIDFIVKMVINIFTIFGFVLSVIGFVQKDDKGI